VDPKIVFCTDIELPFIYGTFFEMTYKLIQEKNDVYVCVIIGDRQINRIKNILNFINKKLIFDKSKIISFKGIKSLNIGTQDKINDYASFFAKKISNIISLKNLMYEGFDIGVPVASSLSIKTKCSNPDVAENEEMIKNYIKYSAFTYEAAKSIVDNNKYSGYYVYNGRTYNTYPITCLTDSEKTCYYERSCKHRKLRIQKHRLHDFLENSKLAYEYWAKTNDNTKKEKAILFYNENRKNRYTKNFSDNSEFISNKKIISFFNSSDDEFKYLHPGIRTGSLFTSQEEAVKWLIKWAEDQSEYIIVIRVHPHQEDKCSQDRNFWNKLKAENVIVVPSSSDIDSYALIRKSDKVISYLSTIGIEATYYGKPSIILGNAPYVGHDVVYEPSSLNELTNLLSRKLEPKPKENCLPYGYFRATFGLDFEFLHSMNLETFEELDSLIFDPESVI